MHLSIIQNQLAKYVMKQLEYLFPDDLERDVTTYIPATLNRLEYCFSSVRNKYFFDEKECNFSYLNTDQYAMFLYFLSNTIWRMEKKVHLASKVYCLNKTLHAVDIFYEV